MTVKRQQIGKVGEIAAREYLEKLGYRIIHTNYRCPLGEIDIIAQDKDTVVIVEVRTKTGTAFGYPEESINQNKARRLRRLALHYLQSKHKRSVRCRIDLISVMCDKKKETVLRLNHIHNILPG